MKVAANSATKLTMLCADDWTDHELIDSGGFEKLERFGKYILRRPEPQAVWKKSLSEETWQATAHAAFTRDKSNPDKGNWKLKPGMPEQWFVQYRYAGKELRFRLGLTSFKHVGLFPEQSENWKFIIDTLQDSSIEKPKVLNLFAYTGGASLAAKAAGADVVHVDSVKQVISWTKENMEASKLDGIRWVIEDAMKFVKREQKRGNKYHGIILDPPAYGRGPDGEKWILEEQIDEMMASCASLLEEREAFFIINLYSMGLSPIITETLARQYFQNIEHPLMGELFLRDKAKHKLPLGTFFRFNRK